MQPGDVARALSAQWPCRDLQARQLASLLHPLIPSPPTLVVHGVSATCKSTIIRGVLSTLDVPHAVVRSTECITGRHLLTKILWNTLEALGQRDEWEKFGKGRCEHVSTLAVLLEECLAAWAAEQGRKFVLVLDEIDRQREAPPTLLSALARLGEIVPSLCVVLVLSSTPRPLFLQNASVPHIRFPPYTRKEAIDILLASPMPAVDGFPADDPSRIYPHFISTVYDTLVGPTAGSVPSFRSICDRLWPLFIAPVIQGETPPGENTEWDFARLLVKNRALFRHQGESSLVHRIVPEDSSAPSKVSRKPFAPPAASSALPSLPYFSTLILTSAYVASHTPQRLDTIFFSKFSSSSLSARNKRAHHRRRLKVLSQAQAEERQAANDDPSTPRRGKGKRSKTRITKSTLSSAFATSSATTSAIGGGAGITGPSTILTARPFPLERLLAIYHAIDPNPPANPIRTGAVADQIYAELATLRRLRLVVPASGHHVGLGSMGSGNTSADAGEKWCVNVSGDWIGELAKGIGVEVGEWLAGGLD
ncbi:Origin recognition complex subunit 5 [Penicillium hispanicum]|uniref:Origin recognition complex subunit 5 n=1 Tax=Penicillium hispanicum TaxID=1080232 RepID=UPI00253FB44C|nr:Origin recognition complex subunit 5 [Penicillium hispanicum]KAJ5584667.1 Origin recognition complex subunit 5 [Penicillium hispanicum]